MLVRWLLKNMNGSSADAQKLRRYPLTWRILGRVFSSIPLFSLAKSLADRRFVQVLQAALKDASEPRTGAEQKQSSDVEMADADSEQARPRKRQRSETAQFDLGGQGTTSGCLRTAEALFEALRALLARLESPPSGNAKRDNHMGAEHIKSLFCSTAAEIKDLIVPALKICQLAVHSYDVYDRLEGQESWISTVRDIWDLHLQGNGDALEVATHFARSTIDLHGRLNSIPGPQLRDDSETIRSPTMPEEVARLWRQDLKRFMARSFILPARAAFLNNRDLEIMRLAIESTTGFSTIGCSVLLDLTLSSPSVAGSQTAKRDNDSWTQAVFSLLEETLQSSSSKHRLAVVQDMLTQIKKHKVALSADSLRSVCLHHGMQPDGAMWGILSTIAELNPDVFIIREGDDLLQAVIDRLPVGDSVPAKAETINRIAAGFAKARDLQGFIKIWFRHLAAAGSHTSDSEAKDQYQIWYSKELRDTISESLEKTMSAKQILSLVDWLDSQADKPAENAAVILAMGAVSEGITQDDVTDEVGTRIFGIVFKKDLPPAVNDAVLTCKWAVARRSLHWATLEQGSEIWTTSVTQLRHTLAKLPLADASAFEAFKFAAAAWVANRPSGKYEAEAAELTLSVLSQLSDTQRIPADSSAAQRVIEYLTDSNGNHRLLR
jgi:nucleolar pre-ribosomal-associated protein 2